mgnify:CR=1 FL=1
MDSEISRQFRMKRTGKNVILSDHHDLILMPSQYFHFSAHLRDDWRSDKNSVEVFVKSLDRKGFFK